MRRHPRGVLRRIQKIQTHDGTHTKEDAKQQRTAQLEANEQLQRDNESLHMELAAQRKQHGEQIELLQPRAAHQAAEVELDNLMSKQKTIDDTNDEALEMAHYDMAHGRTLAMASDFSKRIQRSKRRGSSRATERIQRDRRKRIWTIRARRRRTATWSPTETRRGARVREGSRAASGLVLS